MVKTIKPKPLSASARRGLIPTSNDVVAVRGIAKNGPIDKYKAAR